eukprot:348126-Hanusia_phi.AAC.1
MIRIHGTRRATVSELPSPSHHDLVLGPPQVPPQALRSLRVRGQASGAASGSPRSRAQPSTVQCR